MVCFRLSSSHQGSFLQSFLWKKFWWTEFCLIWWRCLLQHIWGKVFAGKCKVFFNMKHLPAKNWNKHCYGKKAKGIQICQLLFFFYSILFIKLGGTDFISTMVHFLHHIFFRILSWSCQWTRPCCTASMVDQVVWRMIWRRRWRCSSPTSTPSTWPGTTGNTEHEWWNRV